MLQDKITWIVPNDPWMHNQDQIQVRNTYSRRKNWVFIWQVAELATFFNIQFNAIVNAMDGEDAYKKMEQVGMGSILVLLKPS